MVSSWGADAIFTGWSNDLPEYIIMDWIPEYANRMDIPSVDEFPMTLYSGPIGDHGRIPFQIYIMSLTFTVCLHGVYWMNGRYSIG